MSDTDRKEEENGSIVENNNDSDDQDIHGNESNTTIDDDESESDGIDHRRPYQQPRDAVVVRLSSSNMVDFHTLARRLRGLESRHIDVISLYRLHLDYNEAHEVIAQLFRFHQVQMEDCRGDSVCLVMDHIFEHKMIERLDFSHTHEDGINPNVLSSLSRGLQTKSHGLKELCLRVTMTTHVTQSLFLDGINLSLQHWERVPFLKCLDLSQCDFEDIGTFCDGLKDNVGLVQLKLENCQLDDDELADIVYALICHPTLKELSLALNYGGSETVEAVSKLLLCQKRQHSTIAGDPVGQLEHLDIGQQSPGHLRNIHLVYEALEHNNVLKSLCLRENYLLRSQISQLARALTINATLEELNLDDCDLRQEGLEVIVQDIGRYQSLRKLFLRKNIQPLQDIVDFSDYLPNILETNHVLQILDLDEEWITDPEQQQRVDCILHLNRAGRQFLKSSTTGNFPLSMWPILLERVENRLFGPRRDDEASSSLQSRTNNGEDPESSMERVSTVGGLCSHSTIFFLLQGPALCQRC